MTLAALLTGLPAAAQNFQNKGQSQRLVAFARIPSDARDSQGETLGGFGSGMALLPNSWHGAGDHFTATLVMLPDRGWNTEGTTDYQARLHFFGLQLMPIKGMAPQEQTGLVLTYHSSEPSISSAGWSAVAGHDTKFVIGFKPKSTQFFRTARSH